jgi:DNA-binding transcriptional regulator YiaG
MISCDKLKELYIQKRLATYEIARIYNVNRSTVSRWKNLELKLIQSSENLN